MSVSKDLIKVLLYPFAFVYGLITSFRNHLFDWGILPSKKFNMPVICIGNLSVGGTGKTPHTEFLVSLLKNEFRIAILSRGYKRETKGFVLADEKSDYKTIGDEPYQMKAKFNDIIVAVDEKRVHGINELLHSEKPDVILLDDAFQHRYVKPGLSILLTDYNNLFVHDHLIPMGRLREKKKNKRRADIVIVTKCPENIKPIDILIVKKELKLYPFQKLYFSCFKYEDLKPIFPDKVSCPIKKEDLKSLQSEILIVTGIVSPGQLHEHLKKYTTQISTRSYPDHHSFTSDEIKDIAHQFESMNAKNKLIIVTEKDAARLINTELPENIKQSIYSIGITVKILQEKEKNFNINILNYVRKNKRNS